MNTIFEIGTYLYNLGLFFIYLYIFVLLLALVEHLCLCGDRNLKKSIVVDKIRQRAVLPYVAFSFFVALTLRGINKNCLKHINLQKNKSSKNCLHNKDPTIIIVSK